jgi:hypothetical protein
MESSNGVVILDKVPFELNIDKIVKQMRLHGDTRRYEENLRELIKIVSPLARPKALYKVGYVNKKEHDSLQVDGVEFSGRLIRDALDKAATVFICVATCGTEVEAIELPASDVMKRYCLDVIKMGLVFSAIACLREHLMQHFNLKELSHLNPGEIKAFPSTEHRKIFALLGDVEKMIGLKLTENCALVPTKSHSGIYFSSGTHFISCRLCTQQRCQGRRAPYDAELAKQYQ